MCRKCDNGVVSLGFPVGFLCSGAMVGDRRNWAEDPMGSCLQGTKLRSTVVTQLPHSQ